MTKVPPPSATLNRLRAAAGLIPLIESGMRDGKISRDRAALMAEFCAWAGEQNAQTGPDGAKYADAIRTGLERLRSALG